MADEQEVKPKSEGSAPWRTRITIEFILAGIAIVGALATGFFWVDSRYAPMLAHKTLEHRFEVKTTNDYISQTNSRIWQLEDRLKVTPQDQTANEQLRELKVQLDLYVQKLKVLLTNDPSRK